MPVDPNRSIMPGWLPAFNKRVTNPIQRLWAPWLPPHALIIHTGRKSGKRYTTPVLAYVKGDRLFIALGYSARTDWVRNLKAAGGGEVIRRRRHGRLSNPRVLTDVADEPVPGLVRFVLRYMAVLACDLS